MSVCSEVFWAANRISDPVLSEYYERLTARQILIATLIIGLLARIVVGLFYKYPIEDNYWILASTNFTAGEGL